MVENQSPAIKTGSERLDVIDKLRGLMIVLMVLDHTREYFSSDALRFQPTDLDHTSVALFLTRWITHLCAPTFVFLAGVSIALRCHARGQSDTSRFVALRGLWLIAMELTVISFAFNFAWPFFFLQVIWAMGVSMLLMAVLVFLPRPLVLALGIAITGAAPLASSLKAVDLGSLMAGWRLFMEPGGLGGVPGFVAYPILPWFGLMCLGYGFTPVFECPVSVRNRYLWLTSALLLTVFTILRLENGYGDPVPWAQRADTVHTILSFLNVSKYPPSLLYSLLMLGISPGLAAALESLDGWFARLLLALGRTPFLTYVLHIFLIHGCAVVVGMTVGVPASDFSGYLADTSRLARDHWGFGLGVIYLVWLCIVLCLYPISAWFAGVRKRHRAWWLSYL